MTPSEFREAILNGYVLLHSLHLPSNSASYPPILHTAPAANAFSLPSSSKRSQKALSAWRRRVGASCTKAAGSLAIESSSTRGPVYPPAEPCRSQGPDPAGKKIVLDKRHKHKHKHGDGSVEKGRGVGGGEDGADDAQGGVRAGGAAARRYGRGRGWGGAYSSTEMLKGGDLEEVSEFGQLGTVHRAILPARVPSKRSIRSTRSFERNMKCGTYRPRPMSTARNRLGRRHRKTTGTRSRALP